MKRALFLLIVLAGILALNAQTPSIVDHLDFIEIAFDSDYKLSVKKDLFNVALDGDFVSIVSAQPEGRREHKPYVVLDPIAFGYSTEDLYNELVVIFNRKYTETYHYTGGSLDTVKYYYGASLQHMEVYTTADGVVTMKKYLNSLGQ